MSPLVTVTSTGTGGGGGGSSNFLFIQRQITDLTVTTGLTYLQHDMELLGTLTLVGSAELLVI